MQHSFEVHIAEKYGVHSAIILNNLHFWIAKNKANNKNYFDGNYWTYNSKKAFSELFPYMTERQIEYALKKLIDDGLVITGNYNKLAYDRTLWYAITKKGYSILQNCETIPQNCEMEETKLLNGENEIVEPIPDNKPVIKTNNKTTDINQICKETIDRLNELTDSNFKSNSETTKRLIKGLLKEYTKEDILMVIDKMCYKWLNPKKGEKDMSEYLRPSTLFRKSNFDNYYGMKVQQKEITTADLAPMMKFDKFREE